ncbi:MAG: aldehyde ferredoxin oxidoreductase family protein [Crenarchaeota archaeon]|nr:aldehyde ferredoxin oxidoreductase family protein [Thermoproteota archaeon]
MSQLDPKGGYTGKILRVDLSRRKYRIEETPRDLMIRFLGGRGFIAKILLDETAPHIDPLSPDNKVIFATGPLTGLPVAGSGKCVVGCKSPESGGYCDGNFGGYFGPMLKYAGFDAIVIEGRSERPVYIYVEDGQCEIVNADDLWGSTTSVCETTLKERHGRECAVACIGPAGENLVKYANVIHDYGRAGGRPGVGAVLGSKKLKAIVVRGTGEIPVHDLDSLIVMLRDVVRKLRDSQFYDTWTRQGTMVTILWSNENSCLPVRNFREAVFENAHKISGEVMEKFLKYRTRGCFACPTPCGNLCRFGKHVVELDYEQVAMLGANLGIDDMLHVAYMVKLSDEYGMDTISLGNVLGLAMELYERGLITSEDTGGVELRFGNAEAATQMIEMIVHRKGIGSILAEGVAKLVEKYPEARKFAMQCKNVEISAYNCHIAPGMALAYATSPIGAHHKDAWFISIELKNPDMSIEEKVQKLIWMQNIRGGLFECIGTCRLQWVEFGLDLDYYIRALRAATGLEITLSDLMTIAERVYNVIRCYWIRELGHWKREYDYPPQRWFEEPLTSGPRKGARIDRETYEKMLQLYYKYRGWTEDGVPRKETLRKLGLEDIIEALRASDIELPD